MHELHMPKQVFLKKWDVSVRPYLTSEDIVDIAEYVKGTYGPTIKQMEMAKLVAIGIALLIIMLVVMLFMRLMIEKKRYHISLKKALGFQNDCIRRNYFINGFIPVTAGQVRHLQI